MELFWNKYAQRLSDKGLRIMESLLVNNKPVLNGTNITVELSTEGSKIDFETELNGLLSFLRSHLHNHLITIEIVVNEKLSLRKAYSPQEKYERLKEINPNLELLRKVFELNL
ncbi:MAG: DNA polymerase III [Flavobacterium sp.]|nr:DNA polymerase III [Flavobacterium sp.]